MQKMKYSILPNSAVDKVRVAESLCESPLETGGRPSPLPILYSLNQTAATVHWTVSTLTSPDKSVCVSVSGNPV